MKKLLSLLFIGGLTAASTLTVNAQSKLIHYWHFNNYTMADTTPIAAIRANYSTIDTNKALIWYAKAALSPAYSSVADSYYVKTADYDTLNARMGATPGISLRLRNPSDSMYMVFYMPTTHYRNIVLKYATQKSSATYGSGLHNFDYSVDSGLTWRTSGLSISSFVPPLTFGLATISFAGDTQVYNNRKFIFRIKFGGDSTIGTKGNNRFDNVTLEGDTSLSTTHIAEIAAAQSVSVFPNPAGNTITVNTSIAGTMKVAISDVNGKEVMTTSANEQKFPINVAGLSTGVYFINVTEEATGKRSTVKFVKE